MCYFDWTHCNTIQSFAGHFNNEHKQYFLILKYTSIQVGAEAIGHQPFVRNLGVILDQDMALDKYISIVCKSSQHHLRNIGNIRKYLDHGSAETLVHSFVTSEIGYCNARLLGRPKYQINRM